MATISRITPETVRQLISYTPETGDMRWKERGPEFFKDGEKSAMHQSKVWNSRYAGRPVHCAAKGNRPTFSLLGSKHPASHVAWLHHHGTPPEFVIDHIDGNPRNNRIENLRDVLSAVNSMNCKMPLTNTSGMSGVHLDKGTGNWFARLEWKGRVISLGSFKTIAEAKAARQAALIMAGFSARHGVPLDPRLPTAPS
jgi:hypothetical protein